ncbi:MAG: homoserine dehydrogenase [Xanthomonadales bacterium]|nr:homoserine dehydrogenase [Xanthomonadales bacterium]
MNAQLAPPRPQPADTALALLGSGNVGRALLQLLATPAARQLSLVAIANSRQQVTSASGLPVSTSLARLSEHGVQRNEQAVLAALQASGAHRRIVIDATASADIAARHAQWMNAGIDVVSANKLGNGGSLASWQELHDAQKLGRSYGDSATVGAGLPVLSSLHRLHRCGDSLISLRGVFSGSLSYLFNRYDGSRPFSAVLDEALAQGLTEPDPRVDLGGADVARKLLILARGAGQALAAHDVLVENLVPPALREVPLAQFLERRHELDASFAQRLHDARKQGRVLRHMAQLDAQGRARVALIAVDQRDPAAALDASDNLFCLTTTRYHARPLVIQGPGAGPDITAQALLGDILQFTS